MKNLVKLFIEQKIEKRLFASFGNPKKELSEEEIRDIMKDPEVSMIFKSGVNLEEIKEIYMEALEKAFNKLKAKQLSAIETMISLAKKA